MPRTRRRSAQVLAAHEYWRARQLAVDLVILNDRASSYVQDLQGAIETAVRSSQSRPRTDDAMKPGKGRRPCAALRHDAARGARACFCRLPPWCCVARRGGIGAQLDRLPACAGEAAPVPARCRHCADAGRRRRESRLNSSTAPGVCRGWPRIRHDAAGRRVHSCALAQRHRQSRISAFRSRPRAAATPGRRTAARTSSRPGATIPSPTRPARRSICAISTAARSGRPPPCRSGARALYRAPRLWLQPLQHDAQGIAASKCCNSCRWTIRSRSPA